MHTRILVPCGQRFPGTRVVTEIASLWMHTLIHTQQLLWMSLLNQIYSIFWFREFIYDIYSVLLYILDWFNFIYAFYNTLCAIYLKFMSSSPYKRTAYFMCTESFMIPFGELREMLGPMASLCGDFSTCKWTFI